MDIKYNYAFVYVPSKINFEELITQSNGEFSSKDIDNFKYIIHKILFWSNNYKEDEFVQVSSKYLDNNIQNYNLYLKHLVDRGVLVCNYDYSYNKSNINYATGYKLTKKYLSKIKKDKVFKFNIVKKLTCDDSKLIDNNKVTYLSKWFNDKLVIDFKKANKKSIELFKEDIWSNAENPNLKYYLRNLKIENFNNKEFKFHRDINVGRFHSNITSINKEIREFLYYDNKPIKFVDIKNSQPLLMKSLLTKEFYRTNIKDKNNESLYLTELLTKYKNLKTTKNIINFIQRLNNNKLDNILNVNIYNHKITYKLDNSILNKLNNNIYTFFGDYEQTIEKPDVYKFKTLVENGKFYEYLRDEIEPNILDLEGGRKKAKIGFFRNLYSSNHSSNVLSYHKYSDNGEYLGLETISTQYDIKLKKTFKSSFPSVFEILSSIKVHNHSNLPCLLQLIESHLIIDLIAKSIHDIDNNIPIFTIHDSIGTTPEYIEVVKEQILKIYKLKLDVIPNLDIQ